MVATAMADLTPYLLVGAGSAIGGVLRHALAQVITANDPGEFPWGILTVNLLGCLLMGVAFALVERTPLKLLLMTGVLGGFTTFSAFTAISMELALKGRWDLAGAYVLASVVGCLLAVWVGAVVAGTLRGPTYS
jgi:fluoride exporter